MAITKNQLEKIEFYVCAKLDSLNWQHTQEMRPIAKKLAGLEKADKEIVDVAILFHDLGKHTGESKDHEKRSGEMARKYLEKENFDQRFIEEVVYCVLVHMAGLYNQGHLITTPEAKVLHDADQIQQLSEFGLVKNLINYGADIYGNYQQGLVKTRDIMFKGYNLILTENGRKMAEPGYKLVKEFFKKLDV
ncbi:MAG: HD domain-containing protein [Candidatus Komeilibacteria bacterium]|nr:HD domain-containing protein [Candidatus Komeilibacteria bacterium]